MAASAQPKTAKSHSKRNATPRSAVRRIQHVVLTGMKGISLLDLHGSTKKKETSPDGSKDENVFDIQQGVSISVLVKTSEQNLLSATVLHRDLYGSRQSKQEHLTRPSGLVSGFAEVKPMDPYYFFTRKIFIGQVNYENGFSISDFMKYTSGIQTKRDSLCISLGREEMNRTLDDMITLSEVELRRRYQIGEDNDGWSLSSAVSDLRQNNPILTRINYRPFDDRYTLYTGVSKGFHGRPRNDLSTFLMEKRPNIALLFCRQLSIDSYAHAFATNVITDLNSVSINSKEQTYFAPLYLYPTEQDLDQTRRINFDPTLYARLQTLATHPTHGTPDEVAVFDYIYGVLHCPAYRASYAEFLKIDFPRIPWPASPAEFWSVSAKGSQLRKLHLMDPATIGPTPYPFKGQGDAVVDKPRYEGGPDGNKIWINPTQYFDAAPAVSWGFYIGGYQPAQKWLKDRKGRALTFDDVKHYQRILKILAETDRIMQTITMTLASPAVLP